MTTKDSILTETKKVIGFDESYTEFDMDLIMHINNAFSELYQIMGTAQKSLVITDKEQLWSEFTGFTDLSSVKTYVWASVRLAFDPPPTSFALTALQDLRKEVTWRLSVASEKPLEENYVVIDD